MVALEWEAIGKDPNHEPTYRAKVLGGWLVVARQRGGVGEMAGLVFIPDSNHEWN